jgi:DNA-binding NtrC family response regulator
MERIAWIGPSAPPALRQELGSIGFELIELAVIDPLLESLSSPVVAALVSVDWGPALPLIRRLSAARPELQIIAVTTGGAARQLRDALREGATQVVDTALGSADELGAVLGRALSQQRRVLQERRFLGELRALNDEFLRTLVLLDKKNAELTQRLYGEAPLTGPLRILVVDDEPSVHLLLKMVLEEAGYQVETAASGEEAVASFERKPFHLLICDKNLPKMSGHAVIDAVKRLRRDTEAIMITAYGSKESLLGAINSGVSAYLEKPFNDIDVVIKKVEEVLERPKRAAESQEHLKQFKERHSEFLDKYQRIRAELDRLAR